LSVATTSWAKAAAPVENLLEELVPRVYRFALRLTGDPHLAEDITQETFLRAWRQRKSLREASAARLWLFRIANNLWRDQLRRSRHPAERATTVVEQIADVAPNAESAAERQEELQRALTVMDRLPERQRQVLYLCACEELSAGQVADVLGISLQAVKASLSVARKKMRAELRSLFNDISREG
jgi:RNA polymerase sigma-70 factor, ECF subfamily